MTVHTEMAHSAAVITIDRPARRNAVDRATAAQLSQAVRAADADDAVTAIVLTGAGGHFCGGADLKALTDGDPPRLEADGDGPMGPTRIRTRKPTIAAISGYAVAGGLELALWCDVRIIDRSAVFGVFCRRWGVPLIDGGTHRLPAIVGRGRALELILSGRAVEADEALAIGLANRVVDTGGALSAALEWAAEIARFPQACLRADLASARAAFEHDADAGLAAEFARGMTVLDGALEGASRFAGGRGRGGRFDDL